MNNLKTQFLARLTTGLILFAVVSMAESAPITFEFVLPDWDTVAPGSNFGSNPLVTVTVDNGSSSFANQTFINGDILRIEVAAGPYFNSWTAADRISALPDVRVSYISTNAIGTPILDMTGSGHTRVQFENAGGLWQFGTRDFYRARVNNYLVRGCT